MARRVRRDGRSAVRIPVRRVAATVGLARRICGERNSIERQHKRRNQQRDALPHSSHLLPSLFSKGKTGLPLVR